MYDPAVGRWNGVDLLAEQYQNYSPFNYVLGNPINWVDPNGMNVAGSDTAEYDLDPVVITASRSDKPDSPTIRTNFYARLHLARNSFGNSRGVATVDYGDVRNFNNELSSLPYGLGLAYSLTAGSFLDFSVGMGEIFDEGDLGSGGLKIAALLPLGRGAYYVKQGSRWVVKTTSIFGGKGETFFRAMSRTEFAALQAN